MNQRMVVLQGVVQGTVTPAEAAAQLAVTEGQVQEWRDLLSLGRALGQQDVEQAARLRWRRRQRALATAALTLTVAGALWASREAWAATCSQTLPSPLVTLCPNAPALAADVNGNFATLATWLQGKTGTLGTPDITTRNLAVTGTTGALSWGTTLGQLLNLYGTPGQNYGIGVQSGTAYFRSDSNFAWFKGGTHAGATANDPGAGGVSSMFLDGNGTLAVRGGLSGGAGGGNVPFSCVTRVQAASAVAGCAAGEVAVGGGGICPNLWRIIENRPWAGSTDAAGAVTNGGKGRGWRVACQVWGNAAAYTVPDNVYAVCCKE